MKRLFRSIGYAWNGVVYALRITPNMRIQAVILCVVVVAGCIVQLSATEWSLLALCAALVLAAELINTAIEHVVDVISPDYHPVAGRIKDMAAGAVLICAATAAAVGALIFLPKWM